MAPLSRMLQTCYTGGTGRYTKRGDTMTGHALPRIYSPPQQQPADTPHRPSISIHTAPMTPPPPRTPGASGLRWHGRHRGHEPDAYRDRVASGVVVPPWVAVPDFGREKTPGHAGLAWSGVISFGGDG